MAEYGHGKPVLATQAEYDALDGLSQEACVTKASPIPGMAQRIFDWCFAQYPNLRIDTHRDNHPMRNAIRKFGFTYCGIIWTDDGTERLAFQKEN